MSSIRGGEKLDAKLRELAQKLGKGGKVRVGFLEGATYPDGTSVAMVAASQNFGIPAKGVPPRPFFSNMIADKSPGWGDSFVAVLKAANFDVALALDRMGAGIGGQLRQAIVDMNSPALSPVTILLRSRFPSGDGVEFSDVLQAWGDVAKGETGEGGSTKPLVWSGHMLNSVDHEVEMA